MNSFPKSKRFSLPCYAYLCSSSYLQRRGGDRLTIRPLRHAQLWGHGGRFVYVGQRLGAILGLAVFGSVPVVAICIVIEVCMWRGKERKVQVYRRP